MRTLKSQYKSACKFYFIGLSMVVATQIKKRDGTMYCPEQISGPIQIAGTALVAYGNVLHVTGNLRVVGRVSKWIYRKVTK